MTVEDRVIELAIEVLLANNPEDTWSDTKAVPVGNTPLYDVYFLHGSNYKVVRIDSENISWLHL